MVFMAHEGTAILSTKNSISQTQSVTHAPENIGWCPRGRFDNPGDYPQAVTILADANLPSLPLADFKV